MILKLSLMLLCWNLKFCELKQHFSREPDNQVDIFFFSLCGTLSRSPSCILNIQLY